MPRPDCGARCVCAVRRLPRADAGHVTGGCRALLDDGLTRGYADADIGGSGAFAVDSCFRPDGVNRYHAAPAGGPTSIDVSSPAEKRW